MEVQIADLLRANESVWFDRKREFPRNRLKLLHDILCLANSYYEGNRYLVFGQSNDGALVGVERDVNRLNNAGLHDLLRQSSLNRIPTLTLAEEIVDGHSLDVVQIVNRPDKPFFLLRDRREQDVTLRAGVVYTRLGDTNVPVGESAPEDHIELMWRERFGLGLDPLARFTRMLDQPGDWVEVPGTEVRYHRTFPEFTIRTGERVAEDFREEWTARFPDARAHTYYMDVMYHTTLLQRLLFVACDGFRFQIPAPELGPRQTFTLSRSSVAYKLAKQLRQYQDLDETLQRVGIRLIP